MASKFQDKVIRQKKKEGFTVIKVMKFSESGYPDLICLHLVLTDEYIEIKEGNDTLKPLQKKRIDQLNAIGKKAYCLHDTKGVIYPSASNTK